MNNLILNSKSRITPFATYSNKLSCLTCFLSANRLVASCFLSTQLCGWCNWTFPTEFRKYFNQRKYLLIVHFRCNKRAAHSILALMKWRGFEIVSRKNQRQSLTLRMQLDQLPKCVTRGSCHVGMRFVWQVNLTWIDWVAIKSSEVKWSFEMQVKWISNLYVTTRYR